MLIFLFLLRDRYIGVPCKHHTVLPADVVQVIILTDVIGGHLVDQLPVEDC